jgi:hypothetical protein
MRNDLFKQQLEKICKIHNWNPTDANLDSIRVEFEILLIQGRELKMRECQDVINKHCSNVTFLTFEGVDNSDLNALLAIAITKTK